MADLAARARADAAAARAAARAYVPATDRTQELTAYWIGRLLDVEVDPLTVRSEWRHPYYIGTVEVFGITFTRRYMSNSNGLHPIAADPWASRMAPRRWWWPFRRHEMRSVTRIGDLEGWL